MKRFAFALTALLAACGGGSSTPAAPVLSVSASPSPSPSSGAPVAISPATLSFASSSAQRLAVSESGYTGAFSESDTCNPYSGEIAAVVAGSNGAGSATYAVTPVAAGTCTITITDATGRAAGVDVTVSTAAITVQ